MNITGNTTHIYRNVYGGGEFGAVRENAYVTIGGTLVGTTPTIDSPSTAPQIDGCVYGSGHGSDKTEPTLVTVHWKGEGMAAWQDLDYVYTPLQWAGLVGGNTTVSVFGGTVGQSVYGGGELASVGIIDYRASKTGTGDDTGVTGYKYLTVKKHDAQDQDKKTLYDFGLSWPYEFTYVTNKPNSSAVGGLATVNVAGGTVSQFVYGGGKGQVDFNKGGENDITEQRYTEAFCANVRETQVTIGTKGGSDNPQIRTVYGGGEDGHVEENAKIIINRGTIARSVFGGGKGEGKYMTKLWDPDNATEGQPKASSELTYSWTAGKVYGNTEVIMKGGSVGWFIYGGGNVASVGKGNYSGGADDYSTAGYGETLTGNLWTSTFNPESPESGTNNKDYAWEFQNSGKTTVTIYGGTVGSDGFGDASTNADGIPYGSVFGGSRGRSAASCKRSPRYRYVPNFFLGYTNKSIVNIGGSSSSDIDATGPTIKGSIYGGGQDGHVRNSTEVHIYKGNITGQDVDAAGRSGNVFGAGSGIGTFDTGKKDDSDNPIMAVNNSSGSVTCTSWVEVNGGTIARNVYGGGALASVGPPNTGQGFDEFNTTSKDYPAVKDNPARSHGSKSYSRVDINGGQIDGSVFAASRGPGEAYLASNPTFDTSDGSYDPDKYATVIWSYLYVKDGTIGDNVYGGGEVGRVKQDTEVHLTGGSIAHDAYGGGKGTRTDGATMDGIAADVGGNTTVELNGTTAADGTITVVPSTSKGCSVQKIFGCNDLNGTPKGHAKVHVHATQHKRTSTIGDKYKKFDLVSNYTIDNYSTYTFDGKKLSDLAADAGINTSATPYTTYMGILAGSGTDDATKKAKEQALANLIDLIGESKYDVLAVYGGGDLAKYDPTDAHSDNPTTKAAARTEVIIDGCDLTSIKQVYGGGNAAPVPATSLTINAAYEIDEVFGGGNGKDNYSIQEGENTVWYENPGANVGYDNFRHYVKFGETGYSVGTHGSGSKADPYKAIENSNATNKEYRQAYYMYGEGEAKTDVIGGRIHYAYGGSNERGNISTLAMSVYQNTSDCAVVVDKSYGAGKNAEVDAQTVLSMECTEYTAELFPTSYGSNVNSDVVLNITNGHFGKVFGGNDRAGKINGSITINVQESSCRPIIIGELYGGGYQAGYSIYGYYDSGRTDDNGKTIYLPRTKAQYDSDLKAALDELGANPTENQKKDKLIEKGLYGFPKHDPRINIISATEIGTIYGGGYEALVVGSPYINVNMEPGIITRDYVAKPPTGTGGTMNYEKGPHTINDSYGTYTYEVTNVPSSTVDAELAIGKIGHIYGGGNLADVQGNTSIEIGTGRWIARWDNSGNPIWETENATSGDKFTYRQTAAAVTYTQEECNAYNATLTNALPSEPTTLNATQANTYNATLSGAIASGTELTAEQAEAVNTALGLTGEAAYATDGTAEISAAHAASYNAKLTGAVANDGTGTLTAAKANAYNATLIGALNTNDIKTAAEWAWFDANEHEVTGNKALNARNKATITGNVFGGGKGEAIAEGERAFFCESAMVGIDGDGLIDSNGGTSVTIANGTVKGSVYGGGEIGRVEKNTVVTIGYEDDETNEPTIEGDVFGAGKGVVTHGYSALVRGNSTVTIQGQAKVKGSVYGGGQIASVGRYNVNPNTGLPESLKNEKSGNCTVIVQDNAEIGPNDMTMTKVGGPDNSGHVFGAGQGAMPYIGVDGNAWAGDPWRTTINNAQDFFSTANYGDNKEAKYLTYIESLGLATQTKVTIGDNAFVKGDVFGGAEQGFVQHDTYVTIKDNCQIGNGYVQMADDGTYLGSPYSINRRYTSKEWTDGRLYKDGETNYTSSLPECASWKYESPYAPHDVFADKYESKGGALVATNGYTFYGNVFGGGSGYFPYAAGKWHWKAGEVGGNTVVDIKGGHILTNVYGGNEMTNVDGKCTINMSGGTIGVPRTLGQIAAHPVTCYLFGGGMGDPRVLFNKQTNVQDVEVNISGGWIYGSAFGGGEDGHVLRDVTMNIGVPAKDAVGTEGAEGYEPAVDAYGPKIGTWGTSYVDGNVFGGGRGYAGDAYTAGNVGGSVTMNIYAGEMLGSIYGGGRLGSVGYGLYEATETDKYGTMRPDNYADDGITEVANFKRGYVTMNITGGTIGNTNEFKIPNEANIAEVNTKLSKTLNTDFTKWSPSDWTIWKKYYNVPNTTFDTSNGRVLHTKGGNVYAGGMGRFFKLDGTNPISSYDENGELNTATTPVEWTKLGSVKSTKVTISGDPWIMGDVYGGGEMGSVLGTHKVLDDNGDPIIVDGNNVVTGTEIIITGGTIGTEITGETPVKTTIAVPGTYPASGNSNVLYTYGSVYGGGEGREEHDLSKDKDHGGKVVYDTRVDISGDTKVRASVFGGGEMALVGGDTYVTISGGEIGRAEVKAMDSDNPGYVKFGGAMMGNVYGGGKGNVGHFHTGQVKGNTNITIQNTVADATWVEAHPTAGKAAGDVLSSPTIYHNIYGGGALGSVGTFRLAHEGTEGASDPSYIPSGVPYDWTTGTGTATINITGGTIGITGRDNGMVNGSSRGDISALADPAINNDPYNKVGWVNNTVVNIGTDGAGTYATPLITGNVYGGGENGHNRANSEVNIYSGTVGVVSGYWATIKDGEGNVIDTKTREVDNNRGGVYGAGCGQDTYTYKVGSGESEKKYELYNPWGGAVFGNSKVTVKGGLIARNVYGGGSIASVGTITNASDTTIVDNGGTGLAKHTSETTSFALSWPYKFEYAENTGVATVDIKGGHIGMGSDRVVGLDNGNIYGGSKGDAGNRYIMAHLANVKESYVTVDLPYNDEDPSTLLGSEHYNEDCIEGSVFGGGENGHVMGDTHVTLTNGFVSHSLFGGGRGEGLYKGTLTHVETGDGAVQPKAGTPAKKSDDMDLFDWTAGKVYGNTHLTMVDGRVLNNVLGGGYMASVGVGNYAGGSDDFYSTGYGETIDDVLWTPSKDFDPEKPIVLTGAPGSLNKPVTPADYFLSSGKTYVNLFGGVIGSTALWDELPAGNVFGGSRGKATPNLRESYRYLYCPEWFNGYVNETHVTIGEGKYRCKTKYGEGVGAHAVGEIITGDAFKALSEEDAANWESYGPKIYGSVYGGAQDGRVRRDAFVVVNSGEIGLPYGPSVLKDKNDSYTTNLDDAQWLHRGNVYGAGSGVGKYKFDFNYDGKIDDNVEGIEYYSMPIKEEDYSQHAGCVLRFTTVDILGGIIHRNVYGGGSLASVGPPAVPPTRTETAYKVGTTERDATYASIPAPANPAPGVTTIGQGWWSKNTVNIGGAGAVTIGTPFDTTKGWKYNPVYGGEVYGASRGISGLDANLFSNSVWTQVNVFNGATIMGNVYGGGDSGSVKRDTEVKIGDTTP